MMIMMTMMMMTKMARMSMFDCRDEEAMKVAEEAARLRAERDAALEHGR